MREHITDEFMDKYNFGRQTATFPDYLILRNGRRIEENALNFMKHSSVKHARNERNRFSSSLVT